MINKILCMSQFLAFRFIKNPDLNFFEGLNHSKYKPISENMINIVNTAEDIEKVIKTKIESFYVQNKTAILLSGGMDSAILASYVPKGTPAYTFKCVAEGTIDETQQAKKYCDVYGLNQEIIEITWNDFEELTPEILQHNQSPFHSIEVQLLKACKYAKSKGIDRIIYGDAADYVFGGMDRIISKDWGFDEFCARYNSVEPSVALKEYDDVRSIYEKYRLPEEKIDFISFLHDYMDEESYLSYQNAFDLGGIECLDPYIYTKMGQPWDLARIRNGESKYLIRELFKKRYPEISIPEKIPMPRAMTQWLKDYVPKRNEFNEGCTANMSGDQKWLCWCLEQFLNMYDGGNI